MDESLEVVYYTAPHPSSWQALATIALVFDRIHFPGVYMGTNGLDEAETLREIRRTPSSGSTARHWVTFPPVSMTQSTTMQPETCWPLTIGGNGDGPDKN